LELDANEFKKCFQRFYEGEKIVWHLKEIIFKNVKRYCHVLGDYRRVLDCQLNLLD
jgi:hypothetical protein